MLKIFNLLIALGLCLSCAPKEEVEYRSSNRTGKKLENSQYSKALSEKYSIGGLNSGGDPFLDLKDSTLLTENLVFLYEDKRLWNSKKEFRILVNCDELKQKSEPLKLSSSFRLYDYIPKEIFLKDLDTLSCKYSFSLILEDGTTLQFEKLLSLNLKDAKINTGIVSSSIPHSRYLENVLKHVSEQWDSIDHVQLVCGESDYYWSKDSEALDLNGLRQNLSQILNENIVLKACRYIHSLRNGKLKLDQIYMIEPNLSFELSVRVDHGMKELGIYEKFDPTRVMEFVIVLKNNSEFPAKVEIPEFSLAVGLHWGGRRGVFNFGPHSPKLKLDVNSLASFGFFRRNMTETVGSIPPMSEISIPLTYDRAKFGTIFGPRLTSGELSVYGINYKLLGELILKVQHEYKKSVLGIKQSVKRTFSTEFSVPKTKGSLLF
ncbi:MAG: hypothetical protein VX642_08965 [Bdellovibrionota bacterium]|nr:hypothetical protein [Bdellovibrionota bacterium]